MGMDNNNPSAPIPFRAPDVTRIQLMELVEKWGVNRSQAIIRCIERVWWLEIGLPRETGKILVNEERNDG